MRAGKVETPVVKVGPKVEDLLLAQMAGFLVDNRRSAVGIAGAVACACQRRLEERLRSDSRINRCFSGCAGCCSGAQARQTLRSPRQFQLPHKQLANAGLPGSSCRGQC